MKFLSKICAAGMLLAALALNTVAAPSDSAPMAVPGLVTSPVMSPDPGTSMLAAVPVSQLGAIVFCVALAAVAGSWLCKKLQARTGVFVLAFALGISSLFAADFVQRTFTSIVLHTGRGSDSGTNGFLTAYLPNGTNYYRLQTNGVPVIYASGGTWTGFTGLQLLSGATNRYYGGILVSTNTGTAPTP